MVSTRTTAQSQLELQRLDCIVPWLLVVHILPPLWGAGAILGAAGLEGAGRRRPWLEVRLADASLTDGAQDTAATPRKAAAYVALKIHFLWKIIFCCFV